MLNSTETTTAIAWGVGIAGPILVRWGVPQDTATTLLSGLVNAVLPLAPTIGAAAFAIWQSWNKRLVHETAVVTATAPTVADAKAASITAGK